MLSLVTKVAKLYCAAGSAIIKAVTKIGAAFVVTSFRKIC